VNLISLQKFSQLYSVAEQHLIGPSKIIVDALDEK
jgi:hypothetical protein